MDGNKSEESVQKPAAVQIIPRIIEDEMKESYLNYSMSVIVGRALPDARDGLKPVHRRVLYTMWEAGLLHNKPFKKSANVVGNCMAKYHPHGDSAIYDTLVRLAQDFSLRYPLVIGQGNFGSIDGDNPAAMRYTEAKLSKLAEEMLQDIDKETVKFEPNFDNSSQEPSVLPAKLPNLLINGSSGIAVGMATNIPPHNMSEIIDGTIRQIDNPDITVGELMESVKGPDFPTGAIICGMNGIRNAFETGRGKIIVRAKTGLEEKKGRFDIIVSEIHYMVNKAEMIVQIADLVKDKIIQGISDIRDESDKDGIRVVIELKKDATPEVTLNQLYQHTRLQTTFGINMLALVNNIPQVLNLKELIHCYIGHRKDVVIKRTQFELKKAEERAHVLEGLLVALKNIDQTIKLVRASKNTEEAKQSLIAAFDLSEKQSIAILEMRLQRLTSLEQDKIKEEHSSLLKLILELKSILASPQKILGIIKKELLELKQNYSDSRKTKIDTSVEFTELNMEDLIDEEEMVVTITHSGYIKRLPLDTYRQQNRGGKGLIGTTTKEEDLVKDIFVANTHSYLLFFTNFGKVYWEKVYNIPEGGRQAKGKAIVNLLPLENEEKVYSYIPIRNFSPDNYLIMATKQGTIKKTSLMAYSRPRNSGIIAITLLDGDELIDVRLTDGNSEIILATKHGNAVRFNENDIRPTGRSSQGVRGISLKGKDEVIGMVAASEGKSLLTMTENGYGKRTRIDEYRLISRGGLGVRNIICSERNGNVVAINSVTDDDDIILISQKGIVIRLSASNISEIGRNTQGVRLMRLSEGDRVVASAKVVKENSNSA